MATYSYDMSWSEERRRLGSIELTWDRFTKRHIENLGVSKKWQCLEIGGGGGSIATWLCERAGSVVATDLDTRFLDEIDAANLQIWRHDIVNDSLPEDAFDLVHSRLLLEHLAGRDEALKKMVAALKPGGVLLIEDYDWATGTTSFPADDMYARVTEAVIGLMKSNGYVADYGRQLPELLEAHGLDVESEGHVLVLTRESPSRDFFRLSLEQLRAPLVASGVLSDEDVTDALARMDDQTFRVLSPIMMSAWGRKP
ncbi:MAG: methyltransferase domain-containing protein [Actinomycetota bacterium]|nr:methyltransferase domain-containing protein [Actinomycetota bacterium]